MNPIQQTFYHLGCAVRHCWRAFFASPLILAVLCVAALLLLTSCKTPTPQPAPPVPVVVTPAPTPAEQTANAAKAERLDAASGAAEATALALQHAPDCTPVQLATGENNIVKANLPPASKESFSKATARVLEGLNGNMTKAREEQTKALDDAKALQARITQLEADADKERKEHARILNEREGTWAKTFSQQDSVIKDMQRDLADTKKELAEAKDAISRKVQFWFGLGLRVLGAVLLMIAGLKAKASIATGLGGVAAVKGVLASVVLSAAAFALSWAVSQWWFFWACGLLVVLVVTLWAVHAYIADKAKGTLSMVSEAIDAGKVAPDATVATVDLASLGRKMDKPEKALVKKLRDVRTAVKKRAAKTAEAAGLSATGTTPVA